MDHRQMAQAEIARCADVTLQAHGFAPVVSITWGIRGLKGGECRYHSLRDHSTIRLNAHIAQAEGEAYRQTVAHEYAHAVVFTMRAHYFATHGVQPRGVHWSPHGRAWQATMHLFGMPANRCHKYASAERAVERREYVYRCHCRDDIRISIIRHRRVQAGKGYRCARCRGSIVFDHAVA